MSFPACTEKVRTLPGVGVLLVALGELDENSDRQILGGRATV
jgi:hypothetical protein